MSYPEFDPPPNYPRPALSNLNLRDGNFDLPLPTNSWFQEALVNNIADGDRVGNGTPWYVKPFFSSTQSEGSDVNEQGLKIGLSYGSLLDVTTNRIDRNVVLQEAPKNLIDISIEDARSLVLDELTDLSTSFLYRGDNAANNETKAKCNYVRGTPTVDFETFNASIIFRFLSGLTRLEKVFPEVYELDTIISRESVLTANLIRDENNTELYNSENMSFYNGLNELPDSEIEIALGVEFETNDLRVFFNFEDEQFLLIMSLVSNSITFSQIPVGYNCDLQTQRNLMGFVLTNNDPQSSSFGTVLKIFISLDTQIATVGLIRQIPVRWYIYSDAPLLILDQGTSTVRSTPFTGFFRVALAGEIVENGINYFGQFYDNDELIEAFGLGVLQRGEVINLDQKSNNRWSFDYRYNREGVLFLPPHLVESGIFNTTNIEVYKTASEREITWPSLSYGDIKLYRLTNNRIRFTSISIQLCDFPETEGLLTTPESRQLMKKLILIDINRSVNKLLRDPEGEIRKDLNPYTFGTIALSSARVLYFAVRLQNELNIDQSDINSLFVTLRESLVNWLTGNNVNPGSIDYQLQRETINWGGIIVPADARAESGQGEVTAFGNSFYNDHHFHYGYIMYAIAILEELDFGLFSEYPSNILDLVYDYCNPDTNRFPRVRHKDFFYGHSWATGVTGQPTETPGVVNAGPVNRQQESSGEAINSYFAAYLFGKTVRNDQLQIAAGVALITEIAAARSYYLYDSPNSQVGDLVNTGSIGIMQTLGKSYTLDWPMQPPTFPGRSSGIYGIQTLPFTEITGNYLPDEITTPFVPDSRYVPTMAQFGISVDIVESILDGSYLPNPPARFQRNNAEVTYVLDQGTYWGNIALQILAFNEMVASNSDIRRLFEIVVNRVIENENELGVVLKEFDSATSTYYLLLKLRGTDITPNNCMCMTKHKHKNKKKHHEIHFNGNKYKLYKNKGIHTLGMISKIDNDVKKPEKHLTYDTDIESNSHSSGQKEVGKAFDSSKDSVNSKCYESKSSSYKKSYRYSCKCFKGELIVIRGKCAQLKLHINGKTKIIRSKKLPYKFPVGGENLTIDFINSEKKYCEKIARYIMYYHADRLVDIGINQRKKYLECDDFKKFIGQYY